MNKIEYIGDLILLRGLPGSGKKTLARIILQWPSTDEPDIISEYDYFIDANDAYLFDENKLKEAQNDCEMRCAKKMQFEASRIVVANTFAKESDMQKYYEMAERYKYRVHSVIVENRHNTNISDDDEMLKNNFEIQL